MHSNHFIENQFVEEVPWLVSSPIRLARISELVEKIRADVPKQDNISVKLLRERVFFDKHGDPESTISCYRSGVANDGVSATLFNIVMQFIPGKGPYAEVLFGRPEPENISPVYKMPW